MKRRIISLTMAVLLILVLPMQALAATHEAADFNAVYNAFETDKDSEVTVNLTTDIEWQGQVNANEGQNYTVNGNGNSISGYVSASGGGTVNVNADISGGVQAFEGVDVNVSGDVSVNPDTNLIFGIYANGEGTSITVNGDANVSYVESNEGADITINGNVVDSDRISTSDEGSTVTVAGDVSTNTISVSSGADVTISGNVTGTGDFSGIFASGDGSNATVNNNVDIDHISVSHNSSVDVTGDVKVVNITAASPDENDIITCGTVTVNGNVDASKGLSVGTGNFTVGGDVTGQYISVEGGTASIEGDVTISNEEEYFGYIDMANGGDLTVGGNVKTEGNIYMENGTIAIEGDVDTQNFYVNDGSVTVGGNINAEQTGISVNNSTAVVGGTVTSQTNSAVLADNGSSVTIGGDAIGGSVTITDESGTCIYGAFGAIAIESTITVNGNVVGGSVSSVPGACQYALYADNSKVSVGGDVIGGDMCLNETPADDVLNQGGSGIYVTGNSVVNVAGNVTGGNATLGSGIGGDGIIIYESESVPFTGSVNVEGSVTGGKGGPNGMDGQSSVGISPPISEDGIEAPSEVYVPVPAPEPVVPVSAGTDTVEIPVTISAEEDEIVIQELKETEVNALLEALKETASEDTPDTVTINVSTFAKVTNIRFPVHILKAIIEAFGKLEIVFAGGTLIIDAAEFEKLVAEEGVVVINLK